MCVRTEELLRTFSFATTHAKVENSGKAVIARYRIRCFFKKERCYHYCSRKISSLLPTSTYNKSFHEESEKIKEFYLNGKVQ